MPIAIPVRTMPRQSRLHLPEVPTHVVQRGNNRQACFVDVDDRLFYLTCLAAAAAANQCEIHAYVLMTNHVHLLVTSRTPGGLSRMMQSVGRRFVRRFNTLQHRCGTLWEGRFRSSLVDSERYVLECHRYIELNPVRAGIANDPGDYPWSSFHHHALGADDPLLVDHREYLRFGDTTESRLDAYARFVRAAIPANLLDEIRRALNKSRALGGDAFMAAVEHRLGRCARPRQPSRPARR